jgi:hypothetical protein
MDASWRGQGRKEALVPFHRPQGGVLAGRSEAIHAATPFRGSSCGSTEHFAQGTITDAFDVHGLKEAIAPFRDECKLE